MVITATIQQFKGGTGSWDYKPQCMFHLTKVNWLETVVLYFGSETNQ